LSGSVREKEGPQFKQKEGKTGFLQRGRKSNKKKLVNTKLPILGILHIINRRARGSRMEENIHLRVEKHKSKKEGWNKKNKGRSKRERGGKYYVKQSFNGGGRIQHRKERVWCRRKK